MREIKFRAYDKENKKMVYFDFNNIYGYEGEVCGVILPDEYTVLTYDTGRKKGLNKNLELMQYTGLKDKNGKEIYEGDILQQIHYKFSNDEYGNKGFKKIIIQVFWDSKMAGFVFKVIKKIDTEMPKNYTEPYREIIGNIYENPELLKEE